jgi:DNA-binding transcriptional LysR family regulator
MLKAIAMNFRTLDLNLLRLFDALMTEGSLTRAAEALSITQPAASHALRRLHDAVGADLFLRSHAGMAPTQRARSLWPVVQRALADLRQALAPEVFDPQQDAATFRLAMADATAALLLPGLVQTIEGERALTNLRALPLTTRDPRSLLEQGDADLAIGHFPQALIAIDAEGPAGSLRHARLAHTDYVAVMRRGHPLADKPLTVDAFCAALHLLVSFSGRAHGFVDQALVGLGRQRRIVLTVNQFFTAGRVVTQSDLLTVLPAGFIEATGYADQLLARPLPFDVGRVQVEMVWHVRTDTQPAHRWLRAAIARAAAGSTAGG